MTLPINIKIDRTANGRLRAAWDNRQAIESDTVSELMSHIQSLVVEAIAGTAGGPETAMDDAAELAAELAATLLTGTGAAELAGA